MKSIRVLFLGNDNTPSPLYGWLIDQGEEVHFNGNRLEPSEVRALAPDVIVSHGYRHILTSEIIGIPPLGAVNLHISLLPFNRGASPNPWSFIKDTPKGVTLHFIDEGIDTGDIIGQSEVTFDEQLETLAGSYSILQREGVDIFKAQWMNIRSGKAPRAKQKGYGSVHYVRDNALFMNIITTYGWDISIREFKKMVNTGVM